MYLCEIEKAHREIALPERIAGVGFRDRLNDREAVGIGLQRTLKVAPNIRDEETLDSKKPCFVKKICFIDRR